jgi:hypothetical protein
MGYYTDFVLSIHEDSDVAMGLAKEGDAEKRLIQYISEVAQLVDKNGYEFVDYLKDMLDDEGRLNPINAKWYDHEKEMCQLSMHFPSVVFLLEGKGEDSDAYWKKYFRAGKVQVCVPEVIVKYPAYDISKFTDPQE